MAGRCMKCSHYYVCSDDRKNSEEVYGQCGYFEDEGAEKELYKSFIIRLIHCTDGARYEEDMADDHYRFVDEMRAEYKEKYGEEIE